MIPDDEQREGFSLRRWSQRKHAAERERRSEQTRDESPAAPPASTQTAAAPAASTQTAVAPAGVATPSTPATPPPPLPPIESLTPESDFSPFMRPDVDDGLKRAALRKLFSDPHFNVMDGLDVYIDDYSKPDPIAPEVLARLAQVRYVLDPPRTRVNEQGYVEDVPEAQPVDPAPAEARPPSLAETSLASPPDIPAPDRVEVTAPAQAEPAREAAAAPTSDDDR